MTTATVTRVGRVLTARFPGRCRVCSQPVDRGQPIVVWAGAEDTRKAITHAGCAPAADRGEHRCAVCLGPVTQPEAWDNGYRRKVPTGPPSCPRCTHPAGTAVALTLEVDR